MRAEEGDPTRELAGDGAASGAVSHQASGNFNEPEAEEAVPRGGNPKDSVVACWPDVHAGVESVHGAVHHGDAVVAGPYVRRLAEVDHPYIGPFRSGVAASTRRGVAVDPVAVQV